MITSNPNGIASTLESKSSTVLTSNKTRSELYIMCDDDINSINV